MLMEGIGSFAITGIEKGLRIKDFKLIRAR